MIKRVQIPVTTGGPTDHNAWWNMPTTKAAALGYPVVLPQGASWIAIDPGTSSPHVDIAIDIPGVGLMHLTPGAPLPITGGSRVFMHNPVLALYGAAGYPTDQGAVLKATTVGRVTLIAGKPDDLGVWLAYANRVNAAPKVSVLRTVACPLNSAIVIPTTNLKALRIHAGAGNAAGTRIAAPGDFSVTIQPSIFNYAHGADALIKGDPLDAYASGSVYTGETAAALATSAITIVDSPAIANVGQYVEVPITIPAWCCYLMISALAGTGVGTAVLTVEGA